MVQAIEPGSYARPWSEEAEEADPSLKPTVWLYWNDLRQPYWADETTASQSRRVRDVTGHTRSYWLLDVSETNAQEVDSFAVLWWIALMQNGRPDASLEDVEAALKVGDKYGMDTGDDDAGEAEDVDSPEA